ncbi:hypothetical protein DRN98_03795 [Methanosarcinales archaeon]|nr:MAG: hypothetical protein DRN98_03795 [Methanosarcinales archaeon]
MSTRQVIHKGGDKLFIDYSGDGLSFIERSTGETTPVELSKIGKVMFLTAVLLPVQFILLL